MITDQEEIWKDLPVHLQLSKYRVSSKGRVKTKKTGYISKAKPRKDGYMRIKLFNDNNERKEYAIHILVAETFIPKIEGKDTVDHINRIRDDNRVENLRWANMSEQSKNRDNTNHCKGLRRKVKQLDLNGNLIKIWDSISEAGKFFNIDSSEISHCCKKERKLIKGYKWEYLDESIDDEIFKLIPGFDNVYASNYGRIKKGNRILKGSLHSSGYKYVGINSNSYRIHRLVCLAFHGNSPSSDKDIVNHIDGNKENNRPENLEWITIKENNIHAVKIGNIKTKPVIQYDLEGNKITEYNSICEAGRITGIHKCNISACCRGRQKTCSGYKWEYKEE